MSYPQAFSDNHLVQCQKNTDKFDLLSRQIAEKANKLKFDQEMSAKQIEREVEAETKKLLNQILATIEEFGKENGFSLILKTMKMELPEGYAQIREIVMQRSVLYCDKELDITNKIIEILNKE